MGRRPVSAAARATALEGGRSGLEGFRAPTRRALLEMTQHCGGKPRARETPGQHRAGVGKAGRVCGAGPRTDDLEAVARHVRNRQHFDALAAGRGGEPSARDGREVLAYRVHLADVGAAREQQARRRGQLVCLEPCCGTREQGRGSAGKQDEQEVLRPGRSGQSQGLPRGRLAAGIGNGMAGLAQGEPTQGKAVAVLGDHEAGANALTRHVLDGPCHGGRRLACRDHHELRSRIHRAPRHL